MQYTIKKLKRLQSEIDECEKIRDNLVVAGGLKNTQLFNKATDTIEANRLLIKEIIENL